MKRYGGAKGEVQEGLKWRIFCPLGTGVCHPPACGCVHQQGTLWTLSFWGFMGSWQRCDWLNHWPLTELNFQAFLPFLEVWGWDWKFQLSNRLVGPPGNKHLSLGAFQILLIHINLGVVERGFQKRPLSYLPLRKFQEFQELCARNRDEDQIYISYYKSQYHTAPKALISRRP